MKIRYKLLAISLFLLMLGNYLQAQTENANPEKRWGVGLMAGTPVYYLETGYYNPEIFYGSGSTKNLSLNYGLFATYQNRGNCYRLRFSLTPYLNKYHYNSFEQIPSLASNIISDDKISQNCYYTGLGYSKRILNKKLTAALGLEIGYAHFSPIIDIRKANHYPQNGADYQTSIEYNLMPINSVNLYINGQFGYNFLKTFAISFDMLIGPSYFWAKGETNTKGFSNQNNVETNTLQIMKTKLNKIDLLKPQIFVSVIKYF